jgi:membrane-bound lytic murein transglycosylase B
VATTDPLAGAGVDAATGPADSNQSTLALGAPPTIGWFRLAATEQSISVDLLRALHQVESNAAPDGCVANLHGSGALGPFQMKPATFRAYGVDGNHDGRRDICSFADALFSAARYLHALGASDLDAPQTRKALTRYGTDPDRVLTLAVSYRDRAAQAN